MVGLDLETTVYQKAITRYRPKRNIRLNTKVHTDTISDALGTSYQYESDNKPSITIRHWMLYQARRGTARACTTLLVSVAWDDTLFKQQPLGPHRMLK